jgi:hypothetical protein
MPTKPARRRMMGASADSMKAVAQPAAAPIAPKPQQPEPAVQTAPALISAPAQNDMSKTQEKIDTSGESVDSAALTPEQKDLITNHYEDHMKKVTILASKEFSGYRRKDREAFDSAIVDGLTRAAQLWDGERDFPAFAKQWAFRYLKNLNPNRRKLNSIMQSGSMGDDDADPMANIPERNYEPTYRDDEKANLDKAISSLPNEHDQWLFRAWYTHEDGGDSFKNQEEVTAAFNSRFGKSLTRQALDARAVKLAAKLRDSLSDPDQYAAVRNMIIRYYRDEILTMQKERYERRQDRMIREAAEYTESDPTDAQIKAGNYKKGRFTWNGMPIVIENPRGSTRRGVSSSGEIWRQEMTAHYGYISGTEGSDGDQVDVFMGKYPDSELVFVVSQIDQSNGHFDELKVILGETNLKKAKALYLSNYSKGWKCGEIEPMTISQFKAMLESGDC